MLNPLQSRHMADNRRIDASYGREYTFSPSRALFRQGSRRLYCDRSPQPIHVLQASVALRISWILDRSPPASHRPRRTVPRSGPPLFVPSSRDSAAWSRLSAPSEPRRPSRRPIRSVKPDAINTATPHSPTAADIGRCNGPDGYISDMIESWCS
ncbi:hypothetical protein BO78DRAFT_27790 [Aspergillus sclerotiicarbonarius CBS 121057]|uniref:Uncharacterized protein n=1 Tax=Aspergillus sclerotiicarbonarius (strain CBS 121057 / IBT 28362) TaxID=1448318 RepID=A0A319DUF0_ASPSB|nr:hypothetical protein BO78DRAFT_27790 [Aspergillus sclerotiicarbonarius CBS 121057]